ncbi:MAG: putative CGI-74 protein [Streblomastix strix]|uniref:Putative CGI-74 protein n=1 Tax=Streblomastix strix TaxID=222440 RepID=A0A5J4X4J8_9EUKA|nr:MAG: putative CGI-74 protein [Streblomastix strix]
MDSIRAQFETLMGSSDGQTKNSISLRFAEPQFCKAYLIGACPHELFQGTKADSGLCRLQHDPKMKALYEKALLLNGRDAWNIEREAERQILRFTQDMDHNIRESEKKVAMENFGNPDNEKIVEVSAQLKEILRKMETLGEEGKIDESAGLIQQMEALKKLKEDLYIAERLAGGHQHLRICYICGASLFAQETARRLADHFAGKHHNGYRILREKLIEIREHREIDKQTLEKENKQNENTKDGQPILNQDKQKQEEQKDEKKEDKDKDKSKDKEKESDNKERRKDKDHYGRERERRRSRSHHHHRSKSRSHSHRRSKDRKKESHKRRESEVKSIKSETKSVKHEIKKERKDKHDDKKKKQKEKQKKERNKNESSSESSEKKSKEKKKKKKKEKSETEESDDDSNEEKSDDEEEEEEEEESDSSEIERKKVKKHSGDVKRKENVSSRKKSISSQKRSESSRKRSKSKHRK